MARGGHVLPVAYKEARPGNKGLPQVPASDPVRGHVVMSSAPTAFPIG